MTDNPKTNKEIKRMHYIFGNTYGLDEMLDEARQDQFRKDTDERVESIKLTRASERARVYREIGVKGDVNTAQIRRAVNGSIKERLALNWSDIVKFKREERAKADILKKALEDVTKSNEYHNSRDYELAKKALSDYQKAIEG